MLKAIGTFLAVVLLLPISAALAFLFWIAMTSAFSISVGVPSKGITVLAWLGAGLLCLAMVTYTVTRAAAQVQSFTSLGKEMLWGTVIYTVCIVGCGLAAVEYLRHSSFKKDLDGFELFYGCGGVAGFFLSILVAAAVDAATKKTGEVKRQTIRGRHLSTLSQVKKRVKMLSGQLSKREASHSKIDWGGLFLPAPLCNGHFCVVGAPGTGKTVTLTRLMQSVLPRVGSELNMRALVYDAKRDMRSLLSALNVPDERIIVTNPFDARSSAWDMAQDITEPGIALEIASILVPPEEGHNKFFSDAARAILAGVIRSFILKSPGVWTLRDVIVACQSEQMLRNILSRDPRTSGVIDQYFNEGHAFENVKATIASNTAMLEPIAALWANAKTKPFSIREWTRSNSVILLGNDDSLRAPLDAMNRVLFQRASELLLTQDEGENGETWVFLDEFKEAGQLSGLVRLLTKGRSFGTRIAIGFQDITGLYDTYKENVAEEIAALCANKALLRIDGARTAQWAAHAIGDAEVRELTTSTNIGSQMGGSVSEHIQQRSIVLASELLTLPLADKEGFPGYYIVPTLGTYKNKVGYPQLKTGAQVPNFVSRPVDDQYLNPFNDDDFARLKLTKEKQTPVQAVSPTLFETKKAEDLDDLDSIKRMRLG